MHYAQTICGFPVEKDRKFLQWIGTEWAREKDRNVWINLALQKASLESAISSPKNDWTVKTIINESQNIYISDLRFVDEFEALKRNEWTCIKLERDIKNIDTSIESRTHISECSLDTVPDHMWDFIIKNDDSIEDLYKNLDFIMARLKSLPNL